MSDSASRKSTSSETDDFNSDNESSQPYALVEFTKRATRSTKSVGIVCSKWISFNRKTGTHVTKCMKLPYCDEDLQLIRKLIACNADAPDAWPEYNCVIRDHAETYTDAVRKLRTLNSKEHAFTLDSLVEPAKTASTIETFFKTKALGNKEIEMRRLMNCYLSESKVTANNKAGTLPECSPSNRLIRTKNKRKRQALETVDSEDEQTTREVYTELAKKRKIKEDKSEDAFVAQHEILSITGSPRASYSHGRELFQRPKNDTAERLNAIESRLKAIEDNLAIAISLLRQQNNSQTTIPTDDFTIKHNLNLPCESINQLDNLNTTLEKNQTCYYDLTKLLKFRIDGTWGIGKAAAQMLKLCVTRDVALQLTAQKQMAGKIVIKSTPFCNLLIDILKNMYENATEKEIMSAVGDGLGNAKDWDGHRKKREKKNATAI